MTPVTDGTCAGLGRGSPSAMRLGDLQMETSYLRVQVSGAATGRRLAGKAVYLKFTLTGWKTYPEVPVLYHKCPFTYFLLY